VDATYQRRLRKAIHILAGLPAFLLGYVGFGIAVTCALAAVVVAFMLKPNEPWLKMLAKPEDISRRRIDGVRNYFLTVFILIVLFDLRYPQIAAAGWFALALGDGAAGLIGRKDAVKLPWSGRKTIVGFLSCWAGVWLAVLIVFFLDCSAGLWVTWLGQVYIGLASLVVALLESVELPFDDNYTVGLSTALLLYAGALGFHLL
jgi:dolichol kinase